MTSSGLSKVKKILGEFPTVEIFALTQDKSEEKIRSILRLRIMNETQQKIKSIIQNAIVDFLNKGESGPQSLSFDEYDGPDGNIYNIKLNSMSDYKKKQFGMLDINSKGVVSPNSIKDCIKGYFFKVKSKSGYFWAYQFVPNGSYTNSKHILFSGDSLVEFKGKVFMFSDKISFILMEDEIFFKDSHALETTFKLEDIIQYQANRSLECLKQSDLIDDCTIIEDSFKDNNTTMGKKLMKISKSILFTMERSEIRKAVTESIAYSDKIVFSADEKIMIRNKDDVTTVLKLFNEQLLKSEITNNLYDAKKKTRI